MFPVSAGLPVSVGGVVLHTSVIAAPVFDNPGSTAAAVVVSGPDNRITDSVVEKIAPLVIAAAKIMSGQWVSVQR